MGFVSTIVTARVFILLGQFLSNEVMKTLKVKWHFQPCSQLFKLMEYFQVKCEALERQKVNRSANSTLEKVLTAALAAGKIHILKTRVFIWPIVHSLR